MSPQLLWQGTINGLALGGVYILMALGLTLIFGVTRVMQFAHSEVYMLGAFLVYFVVTSLRINIWIAMGVSTIAMTVVGLILNQFIFKPVKGQILPPIVASLGLTLILQSVALVGFGLDEKSMPRLADGSVEFLGSVVPSDRVVAVVFAIALLAALYLFLRHSKYGQALIASAQNPEGAFLQGINPDQMAALSMAIACALAAVGGALTGAIFSLNPYMGTTPLIKGLVIIVLGGMGSLAGVVVGGIIVGLVDGVVPLLADPGTAAMFPLIVVIVVLLARPQGLFGHEE